MNERPAQSDRVTTRRRRLFDVTLGSLAAGLTGAVALVALRAWRLDPQVPMRYVDEYLGLSVGRRDERWAGKSSPWYLTCTAAAINRLRAGRGSSPCCAIPCR